MSLDTRRFGPYLVGSDPLMAAQTLHRCTVDKMRSGKVQWQESIESKRGSPRRQMQIFGESRGFRGRIVPA